MSARSFSAFCFLLSALAAIAETNLSRFELRDNLGRDWKNELVFFKFENSVFGRADIVLLNQKQQSVAFQWATNDGKQIAFLASVPTFGKTEYVLVKGKPGPVNNVVLKKDKDSWELTTGKAGIRLHTSPQVLQSGPIAGVRLSSGKWIGAGELWVSTAPLGHELKTVAAGPVFTDVESSYSFLNGGYWRLRFRLIAGEPVILVNETFGGATNAVFRFNAGQGFEPDHLFWRKGNSASAVPFSDLKERIAFTLQPWVQWWSSLHGNWSAFYRDDGPDLLAFGARDAATWVESGKTEWEAAIEISKKDLCAELPLRGFGRKWMLIALPKDEVLGAPKDAAPLPQQYVIKYGDVPLNKVKDFVLDWPDAKLEHPRLFVTKTELEKFCSNFRVDENRLEHWRKTTPSIYELDEPISYLLSTGDAELRRRIVKFGIEQLQTSVDAYARQTAFVTQSTDAPRHYLQIAPTLNALDVVLTPGVLSAEERVRVRAQLAYLGYTLADPSVWSPERGFAANPNMTTMMRCTLGIVACLIPDHPEAKHWAQIAIREMDNELQNGTGPNGGWMEAPHYATVALDCIVSLALALRQTTFTTTNYTVHPKLRGAVRWLAAISTPPDPRLNGQRRLPEIGNTYLGERTCLPGWLARFWRGKDPAFAQEMQWMWREQGSFEQPGIGGFYPGVTGYSPLMFDATLAAKDPKSESEWFPECGAVFRAHFPGNCETYLHYIFGNLHEHYDLDHGSFILWGKGAPLCEDFGYYGQAPASDHSRVDSGLGEGARMPCAVREFAKDGRADYLRSELMGWTRQIFFVKDSDCLGPNYFIVRDTLENNQPADWRVWLATDATPATDTTKPIRVSGRYGADLVVYFANTSGGFLSSEQVSRTNGASGFKSPVGEQRSLHLKLKPNSTVAAVLYPLAKDQAVPKFESLEDGRVVRIESSFGTDYAFLNSEPFSLKHGDIAFQGTSGAIQLRSDGPKLSLPSGSEIRYGDQVVKKETKAMPTLPTSNRERVGSPRAPQPAESSRSPRPASSRGATGTNAPEERR